jgi:signal transduction histidine kinase
LLPRGVAIRSALAATAISALLFVGGALWLRQVIYDQRMAAAESLAKQVLDGAIDSNGQLQRHAMGPEITYEIVNSDGRVLDSSGDLRQFETRGPVTAPPKVPEDGTFTFGISELDPVRLTTPTQYLPMDRDLSGRTMRVLAATGLNSDGGGLVRLSVLITQNDAEIAVAAVDEVLLVAVPLGVLLVGAVAWFATTMALRPVERIRAQAAEITAHDLHRRVPVPGSRDAVARLAITLNETLERLDEAADQQRRFIADAAHELRSPIASVRTQLEVALDQSERADWPSVAKDTAADVERLQTLAEDLLLLARLDAAQPAPLAPLDLAELVGETVPAGVTCRVDGPAPVLGHAGHLVRLVRNLVDNALRHAEHWVTVGVITRGDLVVLEVSDDGPGIPVADRERVFERFTRLDEARTRDGGGAGLGLAIARDIVTRHGGSLVVGDSTVGARLIATFPRLPAAHQA